MKLMATIQISEGGFKAGINEYLLPKKAGKKAAQAEGAATQEVWSAPAFWSRQVNWKLACLFNISFFRLNLHHLLNSFLSTHNKNELILLYFVIFRQNSEV